MNPLNLIQLNLQSPYEVWSESDDVYFFETDFGVKYKIYFGDDAPIWKTGCLILKSVDTFIKFLNVSTDFSIRQTGVPRLHQSSNDWHTT